MYKDIRFDNGFSLTAITVSILDKKEGNTGNQLILYFPNLFLDPSKHLLESCEFPMKCIKARSLAGILSRAAI